MIARTGWSTASFRTVLCSLLLVFTFGSVHAFDEPVLRCGKGKAWESSVAPDDRHFIVPQRDVISIYDMWDGSLVRELKGHQGLVVDAVCSPADGSVYSTGADGTLRKWDFETGEELQQAQNDTPYCYVAINTSGTLLATGGPEGWIRLRSTATLDVVTTVMAASQSAYWSMTFSPDGRKLLMGTHPARVYDLQTSELKDLPSDWYNETVSFGRTSDEYVDSTGKIIDDAGTILWQPQDLYGGSYDFEALCIPQTGQLVVAGRLSHRPTPTSAWGSHTMIIVYDPGSSTASQTYYVPDLLMNPRLQASPDGRYLYCWSTKGYLYTIDLQQRQLIRAQTYADAWTCKIGWTDGGERIWRLEQYGRLTVYDSTTGAVLWERSIARPYAATELYYEQYVDGLQLPDNELLTCCMGDFVTQTNLMGDGTPTEYTFAGTEIRRLALSPSQQRIALISRKAPWLAGDEPYRAWIIDRHTSAVLTQRDVWGYDCLMRSDTLLLSIGDNVVEHDLATNDSSRANYQYSGWSAPLGLALSNDGTTLLTTDYSALRAFDLSKPQIGHTLLRSFTGYGTTGLSDLTTLPNRSGFLAAPWRIPGSEDFPELLQLDARGREIRRYSARGDWSADAVAASPDGRLAAVATGSGGILVFALDQPTAAHDWLCYP